MKKLNILFLAIILLGCSKKEHVNLIVTNANIFTVNNNFDKAEAFAVHDGKFVEIGNSKDIISKYDSENIIDAKSQTILPGLIDAHCHFYGLGLQQNRVDLVGTTSFDEMLKSVLDFNSERHPSFIIGHGWDQNDWEENKFPDNVLLNKLFPDTPIALTRIDGHAMLCNQVALDLAGITKNTSIEGGEVIIKNGELSGVLIDNSMKPVKEIYPKPSIQEQINALLEAQEICHKLGLTTVSDAGLVKQVIELIDSLQNEGKLTMRIYAMLTNSPDNLDYFLPKGKIKTEKLNIQSVKVYSDGALGSRGATLKEPYSDKENHFGAMLIGHKEFTDLAKRIVESEYQMNTHAIGDSANSFVLKTYDKVLKNMSDRRWRVEHAQILTDNDINYFENKNIIPSVQPTHATSDMYWADERLGNERLKNAYAYKDILQKSGQIALGTDFPIEKVSPMLTFYAAVARQDLKQYPEGGFQTENALTREEALKGMTIWAAYSNFEELEKGSIEVGKLADFIIIDKNIMEVPVNEIPNIKVNQTYVDGEPQLD